MKTPGSKVPMDVSRDGRLLLFGTSTSDTNTDIWMRPLDGSAQPQPLVETRFNEGGAQFSPDARWIAYSSNETGRFEIYVRSLQGSGPPRLVSTAGGDLARWSHTGNELFYLAPDGQLMSVMIAGFASRQLTIGTPVALFTMPIDPSGVGARSQFVVSNDGQRFLMPIAIERRTPPTLVVISNWRPPS
jgi:Tol biopolymer transport system component